MIQYSKSVSADRVWTIYEDKEGNLWVGTLGGGLDKFDRETETFDHSDSIQMIITVSAMIYS